MPPKHDGAYFSTSFHSTHYTHTYVQRRDTTRSRIFHCDPDFWKKSINESLIRIRYLTLLIHVHGSNLIVCDPIKTQQDRRTISLAHMTSLHSNTLPHWLIDQLCVMKIMITRWRQTIIIDSMNRTGGNAVANSSPHEPSLRRKGEFVWCAAHSTPLPHLKRTILCQLENYILISIHNDGCHVALWESICSRSLSSS